MNDNRNLIWKQLQQHSMQPPDYIFEKAWQHILQQRLLSKDDGEWKQELPTDAEINERAILSNLQQYSVAPPPLQWSSTWVTEKTNGPKKKHFQYYILFGKVAAILLLVGGIAYLGIAVLFKKNKPVSETTTAIKKLPDTVSSTTTAIVANDTSVIHNQSQLLVEQQSVSNQDEAKKKQVITVTNSGAGMYDNDLLFTLVNYKDDELQKLGTTLVNKKKITLSQYSYINLSDKMVQMIRDLCSVKRNGRPAKTAKKTKRKFERWKKSDEKYFDRGPQKNPADIIDLSNFIMKK